MKRQRSIKVEGDYDLNQFEPGRTRQTRRSIKGKILIIDTTRKESETK